MAYDEIESEAQRRLFRFGFICFAASDAPRNDDEAWAMVRSSWPAMRLGNLVIHRHPETQLVHQSDGTKHVVLIGDAFVVGSGDPLVLAAGAKGDELFDVLDRLSGRFALLVLDGDSGDVFHDTFGTRMIFYTTATSFALASHAQLLACAFSAKPMVDSVLASLPFLPADMTMFEGVFALPPNHRYNIGNRKVIRYWPRKPRLKRDFDSFFRAIDAHCRALIEFVREPRKPLLSLTGGVDSRLLVSAFHHYGAYFSTLTFRNFHFEPWEAEPVAEMVRYLRVNHDDLDETNDLENAITLIGARNSGRHKVFRPAFVGGLWRRYGRSSAAIFVPGLGASAIRGFYNLEAFPMRDLSALEMCRMFITGGTSERIPLRDPTKLRAIVSAFEGFCERAGYQRFNPSTFDINDIFFIEHRAGQLESAGIMELDVAIPAIVGFNNRAVFEEAYGLPDDERLSKDLFLNVIQRYDAHLATVPFLPRDFKPDRLPPPLPRDT
jgi:hypothetical protein